MDKNRLISLLIVTIIIITIFSSVFAANEKNYKDYDVIRKSDSQVIPQNNWVFDRTLQFDIFGDNSDNYQIIFENRVYDVKDIVDTQKSNPNLYGKELFNKVKPIDMTDKPLEVVEIKAINSKEAEIRFNKEIVKPNRNNFKVTKNGIPQTVSKVNLSNSKKSVILTFVNKFEEKVEHTVEVNNIKAESGEIINKYIGKFIYEKADIVKIEFSRNTIAKEDNIKNIIKVTDGLGRDVTKEVNITFETDKPGVINKLGQAIGNEGETAIIAARVGNLRTPLTPITIQDPKAKEFADFYLYEGTPAENTAAFEKIKEEDKVKFVYKDNNKRLALYYKDDNGNSLPVVTEDVDIYNLTPTTVIVNGDLSITPIKKGTGQVRIEYKKIVNTIDIEVRDNPVLSTIEVDKDSLVLGTSRKGISKGTIELVYKDQYGNKVDDSSIDSDKLNARMVDDTVATAVVSDDARTVTVTGTKIGTTKLNLRYILSEEKDVVTPVNIRVIEPGDPVGYDIVVEKGQLLDLNKDKNLDSTKIFLYSVDNKGNKIEKVNNPILRAVDENGWISNDIISTNGFDIVNAEKEGKGYVEVGVGQLLVDKITFEVINTEQRADSIEFKDDIVEMDVLEGASITENTIKDKIIELIDVTDQYGDLMEDAEIDIKVLFTNLVNLKRQSGNIGLTNNSETGTAIITVTEIEYDGKNLLEESYIIELIVNLIDGENIRQGEAEIAVRTAETTKTQDDYNHARNLVEDLKNGAIKDNLRERLETVRGIIEFEDKFKDILDLDPEVVRSGIYTGVLGAELWNKTAIAMDHINGIEDDEEALNLSQNSIEYLDGQYGELLRDLLDAFEDTITP